MDGFLNKIVSFSQSSAFLLIVLFPLTGIKSIILELQVVKYNGGDNGWFFNKTVSFSPSSAFLLISCGAT